MRRVSAVAEFLLHMLDAAMLFALIIALTYGANP